MHRNPVTNHIGKGVCIWNQDRRKGYRPRWVKKLYYVLIAVFRCFLKVRRLLFRCLLHDFVFRQTARRWGVVSRCILLADARFFVHHCQIIIKQPGTGLCFRQRAGGLGDCLAVGMQTCHPSCDHYYPEKKRRIEDQKWDTKL